MNRSDLLLLFGQMWMIASLFTEPAWMRIGIVAVGIVFTIGAFSQRR